MEETDKKGEVDEVLPDMFVFGGYTRRLDADEVRAALRPPAAVVQRGGGHGRDGSRLSVPLVVAKAQRQMDLVTAANRLVMRPALQDAGGGAAKIVLLQAVVQRIRERLEEEKVWSVAAVEYVSQLQHYPHITHCDFILSEMDKKGFVQAVSERFVQEFLKASPRGVGMWFVVPQLPRFVEAARLFEFGGVVMRGICDYNIRTDQRMVRLDCMWAVATKESLICQDQRPQVIGTESGDALTRADSMIQQLLYGKAPTRRL